MSAHDVGDDPLEALAISRLDGEIDDQRWAQLLAEHQAPLEQALRQQQRIAQALRSLPRTAADPAAAQRILAHIPWGSTQPMSAAAAAAPAAGAPSRQWHPARWAAAAALAACLLLVMHLQSAQQVPARTQLAAGSAPALPQHPPADVQEDGAAAPAVASADSTLGATAPQHATVVTHPPAALSDETVAREEPASPQSGPGAMPAPTASDDALPPPPPRGESVPHIGVPPASASPAGQRIADASANNPPANVAGAPVPAPAIAPEASVASAAASEPAAVQAAPGGEVAPAAPAAVSPQISAVPPASRVPPQEPPAAVAAKSQASSRSAGSSWTLGIAFVDHAAPMLQLTVARVGDGRPLAAESLSVEGWDALGQRVWSAPLHLPAQEVLVDHAHPYHALVSLRGALEVPAGVSSISLAGAVGHSRRLALPGADAPALSAPQGASAIPAAAPALAPAVPPAGR